MPIMCSPTLMSAATAAQSQLYLFGSGGGGGGGGQSQVVTVASPPLQLTAVIPTANTSLLPLPPPGEPRGSAVEVTFFEPV